MFKNLSQPYLIAEIGINHNGKLDLAKQLIDAAVSAGANAVKFQKRFLGPGFFVRGFFSNGFFENSFLAESFFVAGFLKSSFFELKWYATIGQCLLEVVKF